MDRLPIKDTDPRDDDTLIRLAQAGDFDARNALILRHYGFIHLKVRKCLRSNEQTDDWISHGVEAFMWAIERFSFAKTKKITTYAGVAIERRIWRMREEGGLIRLSHHSRKRKQTAVRAERASRITSLDTPSRWRPRETLGSTVAARDGEPDHDEREMVRGLRNHIDSLPPQQASILHMRMAGKTLEVIGAEFGVCRERVRQIETLAKQRLARILGAA